MGGDSRASTGKALAASIMVSTVREPPAPKVRTYMRSNIHIQNSNRKAHATTGMQKHLRPTGYAEVSKEAKHTSTMSHIRKPAN